MGHVNAVKSHCGVLGLDFKQIVQDVHPSLDISEGVTDMTDDTINKLVTVIQSLREVKIQRMKQVGLFIPTIAKPFFFVFSLPLPMPCPSNTVDATSFKILQLALWSYGT